MKFRWGPDLDPLLARAYTPCFTQTIENPEFIPVDCRAAVFLEGDLGWYEVECFSEIQLPQHTSHSSRRWTAAPHNILSPTTNTPRAPNKIKGGPNVA